MCAGQQPAHHVLCALVCGGRANPAGIPAAAAVKAFKLPVKGGQIGIARIGGDSGYSPIGTAQGFSRRQHSHPCEVGEGRTPHMCPEQRAEMAFAQMAEGG